VVCCFRAGLFRLGLFGLEKVFFFFFYTRLEKVIELVWGVGLKCDFKLNHK
jgi:hypothetical protein